MARVQITVLKRIDPKLIFGEQIPIHPMTGKAHSVCSRFQEGQEFIVEENGEMPAGFCAWAWYNIYKDMSVLKYGGNFP